MTCHSAPTLIERGLHRSLACVLIALCNVILVAPACAELPTTARRVVLEKAGEGYRWKLTEAPVPTISDHQVLVRVRAASLNRGDLSRLRPSSVEDKSGRVPVGDTAGEIVAVGKKVTTVKVGARVMNTYFVDWIDGPYAEARLEHVHGWTADGLLADYIALEAATVVPIPAHLSYDEASTLPTAALTAFNAVNAHPNFRAGDIVLVQGTGGVATFATQFAAAKGARVIVTSSSDEKIQRAKALGARDGINYRSEPAWSDAVLKLTNHHGADLVIDLVGKSTLEQSVKSLADDGTLAIVGGLSGYDGSISAWGLLKKQARAQSVFVGSRADFLRMNDFIVAHRLRPLIEKIYPLEQYEAALQHLESGNFVGKIVLRL
jgi:NADPH:quinone reductase-like Zn-dependent oxidoreductase